MPNCIPNPNLAIMIIIAISSQWLDITGYQNSGHSFWLGNSKVIPRRTTNTQVEKNWNQKHHPCGGVGNGTIILLPSSPNKLLFCEVVGWGEGQIPPENFLPFGSERPFLVGNSVCKIFFKSNKRLAQFFPHGLPLYDFIFCRFYCAGILFWKLPTPPPQYHLLPPPKRINFLPLEVHVPVQRVECDFATHLFTHTLHRHLFKISSI